MEARALIEGLQADRPRFVRMARSRVGTEADAEDVVQRAMLRATERAESLVDPARVRAWFYRILRRTIVDHHRSKSRETRQEQPERAQGRAGNAPDAPSPCACAVRLLEDLRPAYADILRRVDFEGDEPTVAAQALGISSTNFYVRLFRARRALRERVETHCGVASVSPCLDCACSSHGRCGDASPHRTTRMSPCSSRPSARAASRATRRN